MRVLYVGDSNPSSTSSHRAQALQRLGHQVDLIDPYRALNGAFRGWWGALHYRTGYMLTRHRVVRWLRAALVGATPYELCWVDSGELLSADAIKWLKRYCHQVVLYNHDDPTGQRDYPRFTTLRQAVSQYDLCVVVRPINVAEFKALGAVDVMNVWRRYDEVAHHEPVPDQPVPAQFQTDVAFIGFCIKGEGRDHFIHKLIQMGLKPAIWGDSWDKSSIWQEIKPYWRGPSLSGIDYVNAIRGAKVCLGLLSKGNRDEHTTRTLEIPYAGGLLCAQRTPEHLSLFEEGKEAVFWSTPEECFEVCKKMLADSNRRDDIRRAGQQKVIRARLGNEDLCRSVIERLKAGAERARPYEERVTKMTNKVYFFDSHPVQYKAPVYQELQRILPDSFEIIYASDFSVRGGNVDKEFGKVVAWDTPLLQGYKYRVLGNEKGVPLSSIWSLTGKGIYALLKNERPKAVILTQSRYAFDHAAYLSALMLGIPILIRQETQDEMFSEGRSRLKDLIRSTIYKIMYRPVRHAFCFGKLNHEHLSRHGIGDDRISFAHFSVSNPIVGVSVEERFSMRSQQRSELGVGADKIVVSFFGKFIEKKNPDLIFSAISKVPDSILKNISLLFVGAGEMADRLNQLAGELERKFGVKSYFAGFVNQTKLPPYYLASDIVVLPSRRMGEAWGLVINEALNAGCAVVMTDAVGCVKEFGHLERARTIPVEGVDALANSLVELSRYSRSFDWAEEYMSDYSTEAAAVALKAQIEQYVK